jgi:hypothetical protein
MDYELTINNFLKHSLIQTNDTNISEEHASLGFIFFYHLGRQNHPKEFEKNVTEKTISFTNLEGKTCTVDMPLKPNQILHFKLLYHIIYIDCLETNKLSKFKFSNDLKELIDNENKVIQYYKEIKKYSLN